MVAGMSRLATGLFACALGALSGCAVVDVDLGGGKAPADAGVEASMGDADIGGDGGPHGGDPDHTDRHRVRPPPSGG